MVDKSQLMQFEIFADIPGDQIDWFISQTQEMRLKAGDKLYPLLEEYLNELPGLFIVSQVALERASGDELSVEIERAQGEKCERCWKYTTDVGVDPDFPTICAACRDAVKEILGE